jgi:E3 ubiquitin-protein ligase HERC2
VACGSSHSICWTTQESQLTNAHEPVLFAASKDPLGTHLVTAAADNSSCLALGGRGSSTMTSSLPVATAASAARLSLSKILLSLESNAAKQKALQHVLNALQIMYAREAVVAAIAPHHNSVSSPSHNNNSSNSSTAGGNIVNNKRSAEQHAGYAAGFNTLGRGLRFCIWLDLRHKAGSEL